jgi:hypothetical protein
MIINFRLYNFISIHFNATKYRILNLLIKYQNWFDLNHLINKFRNIHFILYCDYDLNHLMIPDFFENFYQ